MKNISSINLGGRVISIEDDAWKMYTAYIETLHHYFINEEGGFEIINDIENRVSEFMQAVINIRNSSINKTDMELIIGVMGTADELKELDNDDWDTAIITPGNCISPVRSVYSMTKNKFSQLEEFELCPN